MPPTHFVYQMLYRAGHEDCGKARPRGSTRSVGASREPSRSVRKNRRQTHVNTGRPYKLPAPKGLSVEGKLLERFNTNITLEGIKRKNSFGDRNARKG